MVFSPGVVRTESRSQARTLEVCYLPGGLSADLESGQALALQAVAARQPVSLALGLRADPISDIPLRVFAG